MSFINPNSNLNTFSILHSSRSPFILDSKKSTNDEIQNQIIDFLDSNTSYGEIYLTQGNVVNLQNTAQFNKVLFDNSNNLKNITYENNCFRIILPGTYQILSKIDGASSENNINIISQIFKNNIQLSSNYSSSRHYQQANDDGSVSIFGLIDLEENDTLSLRMQSNLLSNFNSHIINLILIKI